MTVDMKLGMFEEHSTPDDPLAVPEGVTLKPNPPFVTPHSYWTKVNKRVLHIFSPSARNNLCKAIFLFVGLRYTDQNFKVRRSEKKNKIKMKTVL